MASIKKYRSGWRAFICVGGWRKTSTFGVKRDAIAWAAEQESAARAAQDGEKAGAAVGREKMTIHDMLNRYVREVSIAKRGHLYERRRIAAFIADPFFPHGNLAGATPEAFSFWKKKRLESVSAGTVIREFSLLGDIFEIARREWRLIDVNPIRDVRKPPAPPHRDRTITRAEIRRMLSVLNYSPSRAPDTYTAACGVAFLLALRTGMRAGEICGLTWNCVFPDYVRLDRTKTVPRDVPIPAKAARILNKMRGFDDKNVFGGLKTPTLDALFRKARKKTGLSGFRFHDARHTAATWLAPQIDVLTLCKIFGWKSPAMAMTYYNPKAAAIAKTLSKMQSASGGRIHPGR